MLNFNYFFSCFPHIVNLACKAVLASITNLQYIDDTAEDYEDYEPGIYSRDVIAIVQSLVNAVSESIIHFIITNEIYRFATAILRNSNFMNMFNNILRKIINSFMM